jgi:hypothetical protein
LRFAPFHFARGAHNAEPHSSDVPGAPKPDYEIRSLKDLAALLSAAS